MSAPKWMSLPDYMDETGISRRTFFKLLDEDLIKAVQTDGGHWRVMIDDHQEIIELKEEIVSLNEKMDILCRHLGVRMSH